MTHNQQSLRPEAHDHVLFMYSSPDERMRGLAEYFRKGLDNNELCIFVTPQAPVEVISLFKRLGFDVEESVKRGDLRIFDMVDSYLPDGKFVITDMLRNVIDFIMDAKDNDYSGVRTAGEMAWLYDKREYLDDATDYEQRVNELNATYPEFTGLCLYQVTEGAGQILDSALRTHPNLIYGDGQTTTNPLYCLS